MQVPGRRAFQNLVLLLVSLMALFVAACGGGATSRQDESTSPAAASAASAGGEAGDQGAGEGGVGSDKDTGAPESAAAPLNQAQDTVSTTENRTQQQTFDRLVIRTGALSLQVEDVLRAASKVQQVAAANGGYVSNGSTREDEGVSYSEITITVPAESFDKTFEQLRGLGELVTDSIESQDVTEELVDLQSRQRNLEATEKSMLTLLERANTVGEVLNVQRELTTIQGQLEQVKGRIKYLSSRTSMSSITVTLSPLPGALSTPTPEPLPRWSAIDVAVRAWNASLRTLQAVATVVISVAVFTWWLLPLLLGGLLWYRRSVGFRRGTRPSQTASPS